MFIRSRSYFPASTGDDLGGLYVRSHTLYIEEFIYLPMQRIFIWTRIQRVVTWWEPMGTQTDSTYDFHFLRRFHDVYFLHIQYE